MWQHIVWIFQLPSINLLKPTGYVMHQQVWHSTIVRSAHNVFMCFVFVWKQRATCATYSINWLIFITEVKSVYSAVQTGSLNTAVCVSCVKGYKNLIYISQMLPQMKHANEMDWQTRHSLVTVHLCSFV